jgi:hypothetical protein
MMRVDILVFFHIIEKYGYAFIVYICPATWGREYRE